MGARMWVAMLLLCTGLGGASWIERAVQTRKAWATESAFDSPIAQLVEPPGREFKCAPFEIQGHGTTTLAFKHNDTVIVCVDSKASMGNYVGSRTVKKVFPIAKRMVATMAGGAADCAFWIRSTATQAKILEHKYDTPLRVGAVARILAKQLRRYRHIDLSVGTMVAGYDCKGPALYYVDSQGACISGDLFCVGSGSQSAYSVLDSVSLPAMSLEQAVETAVMAVRHAIARDGYSGGYITVLAVDSSGIRPLRRVDCRSAHLSASDSVV